MRTVRRRFPVRTAGLAAVVALVVSCGKDAVAPDPLVRGKGTLWIDVATTGAGDEDGYTYALDGAPAAQRLPANGTIAVDSLASGGHVLAIGDLATGCVLDGPNPRGVNLLVDGVAIAHVTIRCAAALTHPAGTVAATVALSGAPRAVAVSRDGAIFVALPGSKQLVRGDIGTMTFGPRVDLPGVPLRIAVNPAGTTAYVALSAPMRVAIVNVATNTLAAVVQFAHEVAEDSSDAVDVAVSPDGRTVYASSTSGHLWRLDAATLAVALVPYFSSATGRLAFSPDGRTLYVGGDVVSVVDAVANLLTVSVGVARRVEELAISPDGRWLYALDATSALTVFDVATWQSAYQASYDSPRTGLALSPDGAQLYMADPGRGQVNVLGRPGMDVVHAIATGSPPHDAAFDATGTTAVVTTDAGVVFIR